MKKGTRQNKKKRRRLFEACCALLLACQLLLTLGAVVFIPQTVQAGQMSNSDKSDSSSTVGIEEYDNGKDYTGWYTVRVRVVDDATGDPVDGIYVTLNSKEKGQAGHGPNINGITEYVTDTDGYLEFRIYPAPITYAAIVSAGQKGYAALEQYIGALDKDYTEVVLRLKKEDKKDDSSKDDGKKDDSGNGGNKGDSSKDDGKKDNGSSDNGNVTPPKNDDTKKDDTPKDDTPKDDAQKPTTPSKPSTKPSTKPSKPEKPGSTTDDEYVVPGKDNITGTEDDVIVRPGRDEDGNNNSSQDPDGKIDLPDGGEVILPTQPDKGNIKIDVPGGTVVNPDGTIILPEDDQKTEITLPGEDKVIGTEDDITLVPGVDSDGRNNVKIGEDGTIELPDGGEATFPSSPDAGKVKIVLPDGSKITADGTMTIPDGTKKCYILPGKDAELGTEDDVIVDPELGSNGKDNSVFNKDGSILLVDGGTVTYADGTIITVPAGTIVLPDGTIIYPETSKYISFWDCYLHWFILAVTIMIIIITGRRIHWLSDKISEIRQMQENDSIDKERIAEISGKQKKTGIIFHMILDMILTVVAAIAYYITKAHCIADLPVLMILIASAVIFVAVLIHKEKKLDSYTKEDI